MKKLLLTACLAVAAMFAFSAAPAIADHWDHGHGHGWHGGHLHPTYYYAPRYVYRPVPIYQSYPVYQPYPVYRSYYYDPYPTSSFYIQGRNFGFGVSGF
jgi:hypothetical protein